MENKRIPSKNSKNLENSKKSKNPEDSKTSKTSKTSKSSKNSKNPEDSKSYIRKALNSEWATPRAKGRISNLLIDTLFNFSGDAEDLLLLKGDSGLRPPTADELILILIIALFFDANAQTGAYDHLIRAISKGDDDLLFMQPLKETTTYIKLSYLSRSKIWGDWRKSWIISALDSLKSSKILTAHITDNGVITRIAADSIGYNITAYENYKGMEDGDAKLYIAIRVAAPFLDGLLGGGKGYTIAVGNLKPLIDIYGKALDGKRTPMLFLRMFIALLKQRGNQGETEFKWTGDYIRTRILGGSNTKAYTRTNGSVRTSLLNKDIRRNMRAFVKMGLLEYSNEGRAAGGEICFTMKFDKDFIEREARAYLKGELEAPIGKDGKKLPLENLENLEKDDNPEGA